MVLNSLPSYTMVLFFLTYYIMVLSLLIFLHHDTFLLSLVYQLGTFLLCLVYVYHDTSFLRFVYHVLSFLASNTMLRFFAPDTMAFFCLAWYTVVLPILTSYKMILPFSYAIVLSLAL